jgi:hypothetical protein
LTILGEVGGDQLSVRINGEQAIDSSVAELEDAWRNALPKKLRAEAMVAGME